MNHGSLFSGIGGFDLAAEWMGWANVFHCEWEEFPRKVLNYHFPKSISYGDIKQTDFTIHRGHIDVLSGGFPCQPYSSAGRRLGKEDDRHLWPEMLRAIREIQPRWVVGENVYGIVNWNAGLVFQEVQVDLENEGYEVQSFILPAAGVNAPHKRDRVWFVARKKNATDTQCVGLEHGKKARNIRKSKGEMEREGNKSANASKANGGKRTAADTVSLLCRGGATSGQSGEESVRRLRPTEKEQSKCNLRSETIGCNDLRGKPDVANSVSDRLTCEEHRQTESRQHTKENKGCWWQDFPTQSPILCRNDGIPRELDSITFPKWRNESIKAYGNAIVPQVVYSIFKAIESYEVKN